VQRLRAAFAAFALIVDFGAALGALPGLAFHFQRRARAGLHDYLKLKICVIT
jgi:hypothetical protein